MVWCVCFECLVGKQNKPTLFKITEPSSVPYRTPSACAKRATVFTAPRCAYNVSAETQRGEREVDHDDARCAWAPGALASTGDAVWGCRCVLLRPGQKYLPPSHFSPAAAVN
jgi:hypothetical protein